MDSKLIVITLAVLLVAVTGEENKKPSNPIIDFFEAPLKALRTRPGEAVAVFEPQVVKVNGTNASTWSPGQVLNNAASSITDWISHRVPIGVQPTTTSEPDVIVQVQGVDKEQETNKKKKKKEEQNIVENNDDDDDDDEEDTENDSDNDDGEVRDDVNYRPNAIGNIYRHGFRNGIHNNGRYVYGSPNRLRIGFNRNRYNNYGYRHRPTIYLNNYNQPMRTRLYYRPMAYRRPVNRRKLYNRRRPLHDMVSLTRPNSRPQQKVQIVYPSQIAGQLPILIPVQTMSVQSEQVIKKQKRKRKPVRRPPTIIANDEPTDDLGGFTYIPIPVQQIALANSGSVDPLPLQQILPQLQVVAQHTHTIQPQNNQQQQAVLLEGEYIDDEDSNENSDDGSERPPRPSRPNRPSRPQRPSRPNRPTRPTRPSRPDRNTRPTRPSQSEESSEESNENDISERPARPGRPSRPNRVDRFGRPVRPTRTEVSDPWGDAEEDESDTKHKFDANRQKPVLVRVGLQDNSFDDKPDIGQQALEAYSSYTNVPGSFLSVGDEDEEETEESDIQGRSDSKAQYYIPQRYFSLLGSDSYLTVSNNGRFLLKTGRGLNILDAKVEPTKEKEDTSEVKPEVAETPEVKDELKEIKTEDEMDAKTEITVVEVKPVTNYAKESVESVPEGTDIPIFVPAAIMKEMEKAEMVSEKEKPVVAQEIMEKESMVKEIPQPTSTLAPEPTTTITTEKIQNEAPTTAEPKPAMEAAPQEEVKTVVMVEKSQPEVVTDETNEKPSLIHKAASRVKSEVVHEKPNGHLIVKSDVVSDDKESTGRSRHFSRGSKRYQGQS